MDNTELLHTGVIFDDNTNDWEIGSDTEIEIPVNTNTNKYLYNQAKQKRTYKGCGIYAVLGAISDLTGYEFSTEEIFECIDLAERKYGWKQNSGMYMSKAVDCGRDFWNTKFPDSKLFTVKTLIGTETFTEALKKKHSLIVGYRTSSEYYRDSQDNGKVEGEDFPTGGGHLVRTNGAEVIKIDDNYEGLKKFNTYENEKIVKLRKNGVFFPSAYLYLKYDNMGQYETQYKAKYGKGTVYHDIEGAIKKTGFDREQFFLLLIGMERIKS